MNLVEKFATIIFFAATGMFTACKKEISCEGCRDDNKPPIAIAGPDQVITLPTDSISLDGSASIDPDGTISEWLCTNISGPASFNIISASTAKTVVKNLVAGSYRFELKVKDNKGLFAKDTMQVVDAAVTTNHPPIANAGSDQTIILLMKTKINLSFLLLLIFFVSSCSMNNTIYIAGWKVNGFLTNEVWKLEF